MSQVFQHMTAVRTAFDACLRTPGDAAARARFVAEHQNHQGSFVESFDVGGITYPRTDGHRLSELLARSAIDEFLNRNGAPSDLKLDVVAVAYPLSGEVLRQEIEAVVKTARAIAALDWKAASVAVDDARALRELLRMPTTADTYDALRAKVRTGMVDGINPYFGFNADHLIADKALRGVGTGRGDSSTKAEGFATFLQDGQNKGSQHKFATDAQNAVYQTFKLLGRNPTLGEYLERVHIWMTNIYTLADLTVDAVANNRHMSSARDFQEHQVKGFAIAQAGFMTWPERQQVGRAIATALLIEAREHYTRIGWPMTRELPLISDTLAASAPVIVPPQPALGGDA
ncbi:hypothetical protein [Bordetella sp. FB-8]|uniref:hypothetical protein n=1 Tax=Bordetella sp. FB-8 TaxID=1159870 RepID=UPI00036B8A95|nr:hypothetical protein [Bordetella sp. FB-8]